MCLISILMISFQSLFATHNRAGEIIYKRLLGDKFEITIITFTEINNNNADRDTLELFFGDGFSRKVARTTIQSGYNGFPNIQRNTYKTTYTYSGPGNYTLSMLDPNRNGGIVNIPNSIERKFYIESFLKITLGESNNSAILINDPIAFACNLIPFYYNPGAYDPDGDSLVFEMVPSRADFGLPIPDYKFPAASKEFSIDANTGILTWNTPVAAGEYNVAILISEYRKVTTAGGAKIIRLVGNILRDMQITVYSNCSNRPPEIAPVKDYCVEAGQTLNFKVFASDVDGDRIKLNAFGGPMVIAPVATFSSTSNPPDAEGNFYWKTACNHVRKNAYNMTFEAVDDGFPILANYEVSKILVVAPPVKNVTADAASSGIDLTWEKEVCSQAVGYKIYRRSGPTGFIPDSCETGVPNYLNYKLVYVGTDVNQLSYTDNNFEKGLIPGVVYCYLIIAYFPDDAESYASQEICTQLKKDVPILTNVDVLSTDLKTGSINVAWSKPTEHDTIQYPGPYQYKIFRTEKRKFTEFIEVGSTNSIDDTSFTDFNLNTEEIEYTYKIEMLDQNLSGSSPISMGFSVLGTSIYLKSIPKDNRLILNWNELVPWDNYLYTIYKQNAIGEFDSLSSTTGNIFTDSNLTNNKTYCYKVKGIGEYTLKSISKPLINNSQIHCNEPVDLQAPCPPELSLFVDDCSTVEEKLNRNGESCNKIDGENEVEKVDLTWTNPNIHCDTTDDVVEFRLYYSPAIGGSFSLLRIEFVDTLIEIYEQPSEYEFTHFNLNTRAGCYYVVALDKGENKNNEPNISPSSDTICVDNCLLYKLPNVFTPNNDGYNDFFEPFPYCYVKEVEMTIFNRWGNIIFETSDPDINWDGMNIFTKVQSPDGIYYYTCIVHQISVEGIKNVELKGTVHILGTSESPSQ